jgi:hypothetical protein
MNKCTSVDGHFDSHGGAMVQYRWHCLMQHVQGYTGSYWTPPLGDYSLRIDPAATRATINRTTMKQCTTFADHFDGRDGALVLYRVHHMMEEV